MRHKDRQTKQPDKIEKGEKEILSSVPRMPFLFSLLVMVLTIYLLFLLPFYWNHKSVDTANANYTKNV